MKFTDMSNESLELVNGGELGGALAGAILGGAYTMAAATVVGASKGSISGKDLWHAYTTGALSGAAIGAVTPV